MKQLLVLALIASLVSVGCSSSEQPKKEKETETLEGGVVVPTWFTDIPSEPGKAFYGTGMGTYQNPMVMQNAMRAADDNARNQIAQTMQTKVQGCLKQYMRQVLTPDNHVEEEALTQSVLRTLTDFVLRGCAIVKRDNRRLPDGKNYAVYSLSRIGFDDVAENLHNETSKAVAKVQANAKQAFDELDKLLKAEQEKDGYKPAPADMALPPANKAQ